MDNTPLVPTTLQRTKTIRPWQLPSVPDEMPDNISTVAVDGAVNGDHMTTAIDGEQHADTESPKRKGCCSLFGEDESPPNPKKGTFGPTDLGLQDTSSDAPNPLVLTSPDGAPDSAPASNMSKPDAAETLSASQPVQATGSCMHFPSSVFFELMTTCVNRDIVLVHDYGHEKDDEEGTAADLGCDPDNPDKTIVFGTVANIEREYQKTMLLDIMKSVACHHRVTVRRTMLDITTYETTLVTVEPEHEPVLTKQSPYAPSAEVARIVAIMAPIDSLETPLAHTLGRLGVGAANTVTVIQGAANEFNSTEGTECTVKVADDLCAAGKGGLIVAASKYTKLAPPDGYIEALMNIIPGVLDRATIPFILKQLSDRVDPTKTFAPNLIIRPSKDMNATEPILGLDAEATGTAILHALRANIDAPGHFGTNVKGPFLLATANLSDEELAAHLDTAGANARLYCGRFVPVNDPTKITWVGRNPGTMCEAELAARIAIVAAAMCFRTVDHETADVHSITQTLELWAQHLPSGVPCGVSSEWIPHPDNPLRLSHEQFPAVVIDKSKQCEFGEKLTAEYAKRRDESVTLAFASIYDAAVLQLVNEATNALTPATFQTLVTKVDTSGYTTIEASNRFLCDLTGGTDPTKNATGMKDEVIDESVPPVAMASVVDDAEVMSDTSATGLALSGMPHHLMEAREENQ